MKHFRRWPVLLARSGLLPVLGASGVLYSYYVDSVAGNDSNNGQSPATAFATIAQLLTVWTAGQNIGLAKGSTWREQLNVPGANSGIYAYGTGAKPLLDCSDPIATGDWLKTGGQTNVYQATKYAYLSASKSWVNVWENDAFMVRATSLANCDATPGSYYPSASTGSPGNITIYVHATGSGNPASNGNTYDYSARLYGVYAFGLSGVTVNGVRARRNLGDDGSFVIGRNGRITNCQFDDGGKHNILIADGCVLDGCSHNLAYYTVSIATPIIYNETTPIGLGITIRNHTGVLSGIVGEHVYGHVNTSGSFGALLIENSTFTGGLFGVGGTAVTSATFNGVECYNNRYGWGCDTASVVYTFSNCRFKSNVTSQRAISTGGTGQTLNISNFLYCLSTGGTVSGGAIYVAHNNTTVNLTNSKASTQGPNIIMLSIAASKTGCAINASGNQLNTWQAWDYPASSPTTLTSNNNCFQASGTRFNIAGTSYTTVATYQAATSQDAASAIGGCDYSAACA